MALTAACRVRHQRLRTFTFVDPGKGLLSAIAAEFTLRGEPGDVSGYPPNLPLLSDQHRAPEHQPLRPFYVIVGWRINAHPSHAAIAESQHKSEVTKFVGSTAGP